MGDLEQSAYGRSLTLGERISRSLLATQELLTVQLGLQLGLYRALSDDGPATPPQLAARTGLDERYLAEWLEQQAVAGILSVVEVGADPAQRRYVLDDSCISALLDRDSLSFVGALAGIATALARNLPQVQTAFRTGGGIAAGEFGHDLSDETAALNRPLFRHLLPGWLANLSGIHERLQADPPARIADVGCGVGWSSIDLALAYPKVVVHGLDCDQRAVLLACRNADEAGVADRTEFVTGDIAVPGLRGTYDLVTCFEALHDMARPVEALAGMRSLLAKGGRVLVAEERVRETFQAPGDRRERAAYCWSVLYCLPIGRSEVPSAATGAVMRPSLLARYAAEAGYSDVTIAPIDDPVWRFYHLIG